MPILDVNQIIIGTCDDCLTIDNVMSFNLRQKHVYVLGSALASTILWSSSRDAQTAGFMFSGKAGSGLVVARLPDGSWSAPSCIATAGVGWGFQIGAGEF